VSDNVTRKLVKAYDLTWWDTKGIVEVQAEELTGEDAGAYMVTWDGWETHDYRWLDGVFFFLGLEEAKRVFVVLQNRESMRSRNRMLAIDRLSPDMILAYPFPETFE
jgi:hypothetical protein